MIKVMVADLHRLIRRAIGRSLSGADGIGVVAEAGSWPETLEIVSGRSADVALIGFSLSAGGGTKWLGELRRMCPGVRILTLMGRMDSWEGSRLLDMGVDGCLSRHCELREVIEAIRAVYAGRRYLATDLARRIAQWRLQGGAGDPLTSLSARESQVMALITAGCSIQEIAAQLDLSPKTIRTYRYRLFEKLGVSSDVKLTRLAYRHGILG